MRQYVARPGQECKCELIVGWNALDGDHDTFNFDGWCSETRVGIKEKMVLEMPSENKQCQGRGNMGWQLILDLG